MVRPLISFVMTCYNQQAIIGEAVAAALAQTYSPLEIIISDDGSADDSVGAIERALQGYAGRHEIRINRNPRNLGIAANVDRACGMARGELIVIAAGDDRSLPHRTQRIVDRWLASGKRAHMIHSAVFMLDDRGRTIDEEHAPPVMQSTPKPEEVIDGYLHAIGAGMAFSKACIDRFGPIAEHALIEDHVLPLRACLLGDIAYLQEPLVLKRPGGVANLAVAKTAHDRTFGQYLRELPWRIADYHQFRADLDHLDPADAPPDRDELRAMIDRKRERFELELAMGMAPASRRLLRLPGAIGHALRTRDRDLAERAIMYAGAPPTLWALDFKRWLRTRGAAA